MTIEIPRGSINADSSYKALLSKLKECESFTKIILNISFANINEKKNIEKFLELKITDLNLITYRKVISKLRKKEKDELIEKFLAVDSLKNFYHQRHGSDIKIFMRNMGTANKPHLKSLLGYCIGGGTMPKIEPDYLDYVLIR